MRPSDISRRVGLHAIYREHVDFRTPRRRCTRLDPFRRGEPFADASQKRRISISLEDFYKEGAARSQGTDRKRENGIREVKGSSHVDCPISAELRGQVAHHDVCRSSEGLEKLGLNLRVREVAAEDFDPIERRDSDEVDGDHAAFRADALSSDLGPSSRRGTKIDNDVARVEEAVPEVHLGQLDCGAAPVVLTLRRPIESVVLSGFDPGSAHASETMRRAAITVWMDPIPSPRNPDLG